MLGLNQNCVLNGDSEAHCDFPTTVVSVDLIQTSVRFETSSTHLKHHLFNYI